MNEHEVSRLLQTVGLDDEMKNSNLTISEPIDDKISKGILKKIHIARTLAQTPEIFVFDAPFLYLDGNGKEMLLKLLNSLVRANKTLICFSEDKEIIGIAHERINLTN